MQNVVSARQKQKDSGTVLLDLILPLENKTVAILSLSPPTNVKKLRCFLSFVNHIYYLIPNHASFCQQFRLLIEKGNKFIWTS